MTIGNDESLEDYKERFQLSYKRARCTLDPKSLKLVLLRGSKGRSSRYPTLVSRKKYLPITL